jgi:hypothetical protein
MDGYGIRRDSATLVYIRAKWFTPWLYESCVREIRAENGALREMKL